MRLKQKVVNDHVRYQLAYTRLLQQRRQDVTYIINTSYTITCHLLHLSICPLSLSSLSIPPLPPCVSFCLPVSLTRSISVDLSPLPPYLPLYNFICNSRPLRLSLSLSFSLSLSLLSLPLSSLSLSVSIALSLALSLSPSLPNLFLSACHSPCLTRSLSLPTLSPTLYVCISHYLSPSLTSY